jgi:hypothetical protein
VCVLVVGGLYVHVVCGIYACVRMCVCVWCMNVYVICVCIISHGGQRHLISDLLRVPVSGN